MPQVGCPGINRDPKRIAPYARAANTPEQEIGCCLAQPERIRRACVAGYIQRGDFRRRQKVGLSGGVRIDLNRKATGEQPEAGLLTYRWRRGPTALGAIREFVRR